MTSLIVNLLSTDQVLRDIFFNKLALKKGLKFITLHSRISKLPTIDSLARCARLKQFQYVEGKSQSIKANFYSQSISPTNEVSDKLAESFTISELNELSY